MADIYEQHRKAFDAVSAFVVTKDGKKVATVAIKFPRDGAGRLYAYVHWHGIEMVRGWAGGGGYDKRTAAISAAAARLNPLAAGVYSDGSPHHDEAEITNYDAFRQALRKDSGHDWTNQLRAVGFEVWQAV